MALLDNLTDSMRILLRTREELVHPWSNDVAEDNAVSISCRPVVRLLREQGWKGLTSMLVRLWHDEGVRRAWEQSSGVPGVSERSVLIVMLIDSNGYLFVLFLGQFTFFK